MSPPCALETVQLGKGWFPEDSGGLDRYYHGLVRHLPGVGVGVAGLVTGSDQVATGSAGAVHAFAPTRASLVVRLGGVRAHARRLLHEKPARLLVAHFALYAAPCLDLLEGAPFVVHFQGPWSLESRAEGAGIVTTRLKHWLEHTVYSRASRFIVLSRAFGTVLEEEHQVPGDRITVIPGGVEAGRYATGLSRAEARDRLGWPAGRPTVLVVRRLVRRMGLEDLIASVREARTSVPDLLVMIAGKGPLFRELELRCEDPEVAPHVRLLGFVPDEDLPVAYRAADLSVVPSVALEGFGLVVAESLASGTPALVTAVGGLPETIEDFAPQCVIREPGPAALGNAIAAALLGRIPLPGAEACVGFARERYDWPLVAGRVGDEYRRAAG